MPSGVPVAAVGLDAAANAGILAVQILAVGDPGSASSCRSSRTSWPRGSGSSAMIPRYTLPEMGAIWSEATRFRLFVEVEVAVVRARARRGLVPAADLAAIEEAPAPPERVHQLDAELHHDVIAFLTAYGEGPARRPGTSTTA